MPESPARPAPLYSLCASARDLLLSAPGGAVESDGTSLYLTDSSGARRRIGIAESALSKITDVLEIAEFQLDELFFAYPTAKNHPNAVSGMARLARAITALRRLVPLPDPAPTPSDSPTSASQRLRASSFSHDSPAKDPNS